MATARSISCLLAKLGLATGLVGLGVGCYYAISPNFSIVKVKSTHKEEDRLDPNKLIDREYGFELGAGPWNYFTIDPSSITSQGQGEQNSEAIIKLVNNSKENYKSYKDVYEHWNKNDSAHVINGLVIKNKDECAKQFKNTYDNYMYGLELLFIFGIITVIAIIWMIINANIEHRHKQKLNNKRTSEPRQDYPLLII